MARNLERRPTHPRQVAMGRDRGSVAVPLAGCRTEPIPAQIAGMAERFLSARSPHNMNDNILYHALAPSRAPRPAPPLSPRKQRVFRIGPEPSRARSGEANP